MNINKKWDIIFNPLKTEIQKVLNSINETSYYPLREDIFNFIRDIDIKDVKLVIVCKQPSIRPFLAKGYSLLDKEIQSVIKQHISTADIENLNLSKEIDLNAWIDQGVLFLNTSLTIGANGENHSELWRSIIRVFIHKFSYLNNCTWLFLEDTADFIPYVYNFYIVKNQYDKETIHNIPIWPNCNYVFIKTYEDFKNENDLCFYYINIIIKKTKNKNLTW